MQKDVAASLPPSWSPFPVSGGALGFPSWESPMGTHLRIPKGDTGAQKRLVQLPRSHQSTWVSPTLPFHQPEYRGPSGQDHPGTLHRPEHLSFVVLLQVAACGKDLTPCPHPAPAGQSLPGALGASGEGARGSNCSPAALRCQALGVRASGKPLANWAEGFSGGGMPGLHQVLQRGQGRRPPPPAPFPGILEVMSRATFSPLG